MTATQGQLDSAKARKTEGFRLLVPVMFVMKKAGQNGACNTVPALTCNALEVRSAMAPINRLVRNNQESSKRRAIRQFCPTCGAIPSFPCTGSRGKQRISIHRDRYAVSRGEVPA